METEVPQCLTFLVFAIAMNGYAKIWKSCLHSQKAYCTKNGYEYRVVTEKSYPDSLSKSELHPKWKKIEYLLYLLKTTSVDYILLLDADIKVMPDCPPLHTILVPEKCIYAVMGSGRHCFNGVASGFILVKRCEEALTFFHRMFRSKKRKVPIEYRVTPLGENGHFWWLWSHYKKLFKILPVSWNNAQFQSLHPEYMRHYTAVVGKKIVD